MPHCAPIDANTPRTPLWRGLTLVQELEAAGVNVGAASDNVRDWWHPYGDYDGLSNLRGAITIGQLDTAPNEGHWARLVSDSPAKAMGLIKSSNGQDDGPCALSPGAPADLVLFPSARSFSGSYLGRRSTASYCALAACRSPPYPTTVSWMTLSR